MFKRIAAVLALVLGLSLLVPLSASAHIKGNAYHQGANVMPTGLQLDDPHVKQVYCQMHSDGMNEVVLDLIYEQQDIHSTKIWRRSDSPTDAQLIKAIANARACRLRVILKPHLEVTNHEWRAHIAFSNNRDADAWQKSWTDILVHLAKFKNVDELVVGTEMRGVVTTAVPSKNLKFNKNNPARWVKTLDTVHKANKKLKLTYAAHTNDESLYLPKSFVSKLTELSLTYYPRPPSGVKNPSVKQLRDDMKKDQKQYFDPLYKRYHKKIVFAETGFRSITAAAYYERVDQVGPGDVDLQSQVNQYEAFFEFADHISYVRGVWLYRYYNSVDAGGAGDPWFTPQNKPAEKVIKDWFNRK